MKPYRTLMVLWCLIGWFLCPAPGPVSAYDINKTPERWPVLFFSSRGTRDGAPEGWAVQRHRGEPVMTMNTAEGPAHLAMVSRGDTAFGIKKVLAVDLRETPFLNWQWRVNRLPKGGDVRRVDSDDQALQIYLIFGIPGSTTLFQEPTLSYIWDNEAPRGLLVKSPQRWLGAVRYMVVRNGTDPTGRWHREKRNVSTDSHNAFGEFGKKAPPDFVRGILLFINTHHTKGEAEADMGEIFFSRE